MTRFARLRGRRIRVEDYIERIALVEGEQKEQLKKLEKEKAVAERARETKEEFDDAHVILQQSRHLTAKAEIKHHADERTRYLAEAADLESKVKDAEIILLSLDDRIGELETQISEAMGGDKGGLNSQIGELQVSLALNRDRIDEAELADIEANELLEDLEEQITAAKNDLESHESTLLSAKESLDASKKAFAETEAIEAEIRQNLENSGTANASLSRALSQANDALESCRESVTAAKVEVEKVANQADMVAEQLSAAEETVEDAKLAYDDLQLQIEELGESNPENDRTALGEELRKAQSAEKKLIDESSAVNNRLQDAERKLAAARTELDKRSGSNGWHLEPQR